MPEFDLKTEKDVLVQRSVSERPAHQEKLHHARK